MQPETQADEREFTITLDLLENYQFHVAFDSPGIAPLLVDEIPPIGEGAGPSPSRMLATSVAHCLASSALYCLRKARIDVQEMHATVRGAMVRNERGRLRMGSLSVSLEPKVAPADVPRMQRCLDIFEDFCVITQSVRQGLPVDVSVAPAH